MTLILLMVTFWGRGPVAHYFQVTDWDNLTNITSITFVSANMKISPYQQIGELFEVTGSSTRIRVMLAIYTGKTCVYYLESLLSLRQAYFSQQLMELHEKGILASRRERKFIDHHLKIPEMLDLIRLAACMIDSIPQLSNFFG